MSIIDYVPPDTINAFIKDYKPHDLFFDWIVGPVGCLPADSEFLTPAGWRRMDAYQTDDLVAVYKDGEVFFEPAEYVCLPATTPFIRFDSGSLEMELSPEHKVLYNDYRGVSQVATAAECAAHPSRRTIPTTFSLVRDDVRMGEAEIRMRIAFSADGHIPERGQQQFIVVRKEYKKTRLRELLRDAGIPWKETTYAQRETETRFTLRWPEASKSLNFVWGLSTRQLEIVLDECLRWDGLNEHAEKRYYSTVKRHADAIQFAAHACGFRATIKAVYDSQHPEWLTQYTVQIRVADNHKNKAAIRTDTTRISCIEPVGGLINGMKYCFSTSTGFFVARCNDTIFVTGNSGKTTGIFFKLAYMASLQAPWADGIRRTRAVIVRNTNPQLTDTTLVSWNYWFKDGQAGKWQATNKIFTLRFGDVECEVLFRPLDTEDDVARVLSLEVTFVLIDEFVQIPKKILEAISARAGRFPPPKDGGATNYGVWGSSNPSTEDSWWFDYLHDATKVRKMTRANLDAPRMPDDNRTITYFHQPGGFDPDAENLVNLPPRDGSNKYYLNLAAGNSEAWVKQFVEAEWGFSISGQAVVPTFKASIHISNGDIRYNKHLPLIIGLDPGITGSALIFGQEDLQGRLNVLGELVQSGYGADRLISEKLKPYLRRRFPDIPGHVPGMIVIAADPAANNRTQTDEKTVVDRFKQHFMVHCETNNRLPLRLDAIEHFTTRLTVGGAALQIDAKECPTLIRALKGGWRYTMDTKKDDIKGIAPEKNQYSHPGDSFGYLCRYFHRRTERELRYHGGDGDGRGKRPLTQNLPNYHFV